MYLKVLHRIRENLQKLDWWTVMSVISIILKHLSWKRGLKSFTRLSEPTSSRWKNSRQSLKKDHQWRWSSGGSFKKKKKKQISDITLLFRADCKCGRETVGKDAWRGGGRRGRDHLHSPHFPPGLSGVCVLAGQGSCRWQTQGRRVSGVESWAGVRCHGDSATYRILTTLPPFYSSFGSTLRGCQPVFHGPTAWAVSARWVLCLIQERAQRFGTKTQRGSTHPLLSHAKLGTAFPPAVKNVWVYTDVSELADVSPASSPCSDRLHSNTSGSENWESSSSCSLGRSDECELQLWHLSERWILKIANFMTFNTQHGLPAYISIFIYRCTLYVHTVGYWYVYITWKSLTVVQFLTFQAFFFQCK